MERRERRIDIDEEEIRRERISREVIIMTEDEAEAEAEEAEEAVEVDEPMEVRQTKSLWQHITTGSLLTAGAAQYYRYLIAIAVMCFLSIFLTFMSLNADREHRRKEKYATVLHERSVLKEEERYSLSSKAVVTRRLKEHGVELVDLSPKSRLIEKSR